MAFAFQRFIRTRTIFKRGYATLSYKEELEAAGKHAAGTLLTHSHGLLSYRLINLMHNIRFLSKRLEISGPTVQYHIYNEPELASCYSRFFTKTIHAFIRCEQHF